jgi:hypothetical protein
MIRRLIKDARDQLGWQGVTGIGLLLFAGVFLQVALNPLEQETTIIHARLQTARSDSRDGAQAFAGSDRQRELARFFAALPQEKDVTDTLAVIYDVAQKAGLRVQHAEYHVDNSNSSELCYQMNFPMQGEYPRIRAFLSRVLADNPALALDHISFRRDHIGDTTMNADVRFTLFLRPSQ